MSRKESQCFAMDRCRESVNLWSLRLKGLTPDEWWEGRKEGRGKTNEGGKEGVH